MPFLTPQKKDLKSQLNSLFEAILETFRTFSGYLIDFSRPFSGGSKMAFFGLRNALFGFPGCRALYGAGGGRKTRGLFNKVHVLDILEKLEIVELLESGQRKGIHPFSTVSRESREFREVLEFLNRRDPFRNDPFFRSPLKVDISKGTCDKVDISKRDI